MKKFIATILLTSFITTSAHAQELELPKVETPEGEADPGEAISPMKMNQKAPFSGVLLSPKALAVITAKLKSVDSKVKLASEEAKETANEVCRNEKANMTIVSDTDKTILRARIQDNERNLTMYENRIREMNDSHINSGALVGLGVAGGVVASVLTFFAVAQALK